MVSRATNTDIDLDDGTRMLNDAAVEDEWERTETEEIIVPSNESQVMSNLTHWQPRRAARFENENEIYGV